MLIPQDAPPPPPAMTTGVVVPLPANRPEKPPPLEPALLVSLRLGPPAPPPPYPDAVSRASPRSPTTTLNASFGDWIVTVDFTYPPAPPPG